MMLRIEYVGLNSLKEYNKNSRTHGEGQVEQLVKSMREFGFVNPVLVDEDNVVIAGHGRIKAAHLVPLTEVPVIRLPNMSDAQKRALRIADNKIALNSGWDFEKLSDELSDLVMDDFALDLTGFSEQEIDTLLKSELSVLPAWVDQSSPINSGGGRELPREQEGELIPLGPSVALTSNTIKKLQFGSYGIPLTDEEFEFMEQKVKGYLDDNGTLAGFVSRNWFENGGDQ